MNHLTYSSTTPRAMRMVAAQDTWHRLILSQSWGLHGFTFPVG